MQVSAVIPTCNRKKRLLFLLECLDKSGYALQEVIVVDSGEDRLSQNDLSAFNNLHIVYLSSERSVCVQRNTGIRSAVSPWVFLCDDDIELPPGYLEKLIEHIKLYPGAGAVSGLFLQKEKNEWTATYPVVSMTFLLWQYIFKLSLWGEIRCKSNVVTRGIKNYYSKKGNHISKAGWPVITDFSGDYFTAPLYSLGASLVQKAWLMNSPFDEVLDSHGIGEHYGVIAGFPAPAIQVLNHAFVYHHHEEMNRLQNSLEYYRRVLALDYFRRIKKHSHIKKAWLLWSLFGNLLVAIFKRKRAFVKANLKLLVLICLNRNPYYLGYKTSKKIVQPVFE